MGRGDDDDPGCPGAGRGAERVDVDRREARDRSRRDTDMSPRPAANGVRGCARRPRSERDGLRRHAAARERRCPAPRGEGDGVVRLELRAEREREPRHERVAAAVGILARARDGAAVYGPPGCIQPPSAPEVVTTRSRLRIEIARVVALGLVLAAADQRVERDPAAAERCRDPAPWPSARARGARSAAPRRRRR